MRQAKKGDTVQVHYRGTLADGTEFDSSAGRDPIELSIGDGEVIAGFEDALVGMAEGDQKTINLEPDDAYGPREPQLVHVLPREQMPSEVELQVGNVLQATDQSGNQLRLIIVGLSDADVTLDGNHILAGKALTFELSLVGIAG